MIFIAICRDEKPQFRRIHGRTSSSRGVRSRGTHLTDFEFHQMSNSQSNRKITPKHGIEVENNQNEAELRPAIENVLKDLSANVSVQVFKVG